MTAEQTYDEADTGHTLRHISTVDRSGEPLLDVRDLNVVFKLRRRRQVRAVRDVSFEVYPGETMALVGESGSGKSTTARGVMRLVKPHSGEVRFEGRSLASLSGRDLRKARRNMQMVFQDPYSSMDPSMTVSDSLAEPLQAHTSMSRSEQRSRAEELLEHVGLRPEHALRYPYEFSGGQRQRVAIARAIALNPRLVIADEAVSALDVSSQNQILQLLERLKADLGVAYLFISHDLGVVRHIADRVAVMYLGRIVEQGGTQDLFTAPTHPYTQGLLSAVPVPNPKRQAERRRIRLEGELPDPTNPPTGCAFNTRCPYAMDICRAEVPAATPRQGGGTVACHLHTSGPMLGGAPLESVELTPRADRS